MSDNKERIRKFIIKQIAGDVRFSEEEHTFQLCLRSITTEKKALFRKEMRKYLEWEKRSDAEIDAFCNEVRNSVNLCYNTRTASFINVDVKEMCVGEKVTLHSKDEALGEDKLHLLYIGNNRFFVLSSARLAIQKTDILELYNTDIWSIGHPVLFVVYRRGKRIPEGKQLVYRTYPLVFITKEHPSIIHELIDSKCDFTYEEMMAKQSSKADWQLDFKSPVMGLLMHNHSTQMPLYADVDDDGIIVHLKINGDYRSSDLSRLKVVCAGENISSAKDYTGVAAEARIDGETGQMLVTKKMNKNK